MKNPKPTAVIYFLDDLLAAVLGSEAVWSVEVESDDRSWTEVNQYAVRVIADQDYRGTEDDPYKHGLHSETEGTD